MSKLDEDEGALLKLLRQHERGLDSETIVRISGADPSTVVDIMNRLSNKGLVQFVSLNKKLAFKAIAEEEVQKTKNLTEFEKIVYEIITAEKSKGLWIKEIKERSGLHSKVVTDCIKSLEKNNLIKAVKSVKHSTRKHYMGFDFEPSEELTGNNFYTDQDLDVPFIESLCETVHKYIYSKSFPYEATNEDFPPTYSDYPTTRQIARFINKAKITTVRLSLPETQQLVDRLFYDKKIQKMMKFKMDDSSQSDQDMSGEEEFTSRNEMELYTSWMYKSYRTVDIEDLRQTSMEGTWTHIPCGVCPVSGFCRPKGPVSPETCVYMDEWLKEPLLF